MRDENYGSFDYFFEFGDSFFNKDFVSNVLMHNFLSFHVGGYNGDGHFIGYMRNNNGHIEQPIKKERNETSTIISTISRYYIDPKLELEKNEKESIIRISHIKNGNLVLETFTTSKDSDIVSINTFIYDHEVTDALLETHKEECRNAELNFEKLKSDSVHPINTIKREIDGNDKTAYDEYTSELDGIVENLSNENRRHK